MQYNTLADSNTVNTTIQALTANGIQAELVSDREALKQKIAELIPAHAELMEFTSRTLDDLGITEWLRTSGKYDLVKEKLKQMDRATQDREMTKLGSAPDYAISSVSAITQTGELVWASRTGSQLAGLAYGASKIVIVAGTQKIVPDMGSAMSRIEDYIFPLESERVKQAYGMSGSSINKILTIKKEDNPQRIHVLFINEAVGF